MKEYFKPEASGGNCLTCSCRACRLQAARQQRQHAGQVQ